MRMSLYSSHAGILLSSVCVPHPSRLMDDIGVDVTVRGGVLDQHNNIKCVCVSLLRCEILHHILWQHVRNVDRSLTHFRKRGIHTCTHTHARAHSLSLLLSSSVWGIQTRVAALLAPHQHYITDVSAGAHTQSARACAYGVP